MIDMDKIKHRSGPYRLKAHDYGSDDWYFVTICTKYREHYFGEIIQPLQHEVSVAQNLAPPQMSLTPIGKIAFQYWTEIPDHFPFVVVDEFVIMPDHMHGLIYFNKPDHPYRLDKYNEFGPQSKNLASVIRGYKAAVKKYATLNNIPFQWQSRYHDHVVRTEKRLLIIQKYIRNNPSKWFEKKHQLI